MINCIKYWLGMLKSSIGTHLINGLYSLITRIGSISIINSLVIICLITKLKGKELKLVFILRIHLNLTFNLLLLINNMKLLKIL